VAAAQDTVRGGGGGGERQVGRKRKDSGWCTTVGGYEMEGVDGRGAEGAHIESNASARSVSLRGTDARPDGECPDSGFDAQFRKWEGELESR